MENLTKRVLDRDRTAILLARQLGSAANASLEKLSGNPDPEIREIALHCLNETGGDDAMREFVRALADSDSQVRAAALNGVRNHVTPAFYTALITAYDQSKEAYVRQQLLLVLGRGDGGSYTMQLKSRCSGEKEAAVQEGCVVALARLGDEGARTEFVRRLLASAGRDRERYFDYCEYIQAAWLLKPLASLLADKTNLVYVGLHDRPDLIQYLRTCDLALNLMASISGGKFSFPVNRSTNYSDAQLAEAQRYVDQPR